MDISVVIPIYNVEDYILECLQSVAEQSKTEGVECLLVDDCGTDDSMKIAENYISSYKGNINFRLLFHEKNKGLSVARNTGVRAAKGKYLFFLDSDDTIKPCCLELLYGQAEQYSADMVQGTYESESKYLLLMGKAKLPFFSDDRSFIKRTLLDYDLNPIMAQNRLLKKQVVLDNHLYFKEGIIHEDQYWNFFLAKVIRRIVFCKEKTYFYRMNPKSITNKVNIGKECLAFKVMIADFCQSVDSEDINSQIKYIFCSLLRAIDSKFYGTQKDKQVLLSSYKKQIGFMSQVLVDMIFYFQPNTWMRRKLINLYLRNLN